jgi:hypothetical protein
LRPAFGPVHPTSGLWHVAQDTQSGLEILSKNRFLPSFSMGVRPTASAVIDADKNNIDNIITVEALAPKLLMFILSSLFYWCFKVKIRFANTSLQANKNKPPLLSDREIIELLLRTYLNNPALR